MGRGAWKKSTLVHVGDSEGVHTCGEEVAAGAVETAGHPELEWSLKTCELLPPEDKTRTGEELLLTGEPGKWLPEVVCAPGRDAAKTVEMTIRVEGVT